MQTGSRDQRGRHETATAAAATIAAGAVLGGLVTLLLSGLATALFVALPLAFLAAGLAFATRPRAHRDGPLPEETAGVALGLALFGEAPRRS